MACDSEQSEKLSELIANRRARVGVVGLGYVGLPLARMCVNNGYRIVGFDRDTEKIETLRSGASPIHTFSDDWVSREVERETFVPVNQPEALHDTDVLLICVPTPMTEDHNPDTSYISSATETVRDQLRPGQLVLLESTTYPGTTRELVKPILEQSGMRVGTDVFLAYSPEREDPGNETFPMDHIPKVVGGIDDASHRLAVQFYQSLTVSVVSVDSPEEAEATKLMENIFRAANIALVNEMKDALSAMNINIWNVIRAASTKPFGYMPFYPGPGVGGHCIPKDLYYMIWRAKQEGLNMDFLEHAGEINRSMPDRVTENILQTLEERGHTPDSLSGLLLGVAYKPNVDDVRASPGLEIFHLLEQAGITMSYHDPFVPSVPHPADSSRLLESVSSLPEALEGHDFAIIATDHSTYDPATIIRHAPLIFDSRNLMGDLGNGSEKVVGV